LLYLGVTGHRFLTRLDLLQAGIRRALVEIERAYHAEQWAVISSLAEGADRLAVQCVWEHRPQAHLIVPLPLPAEAYERDFHKLESRQEFRSLLRRATEIMDPAPAPTRREAYRSAGLRILDRAAVLLALWDGKPPRLRGGTGDIVALARSRGLPLAWVHSGNRANLGAEQGQVSLEGFP